MELFRIALAGNPNTGKSTIFNALTGANQHVGNWPGKTIARRAGWFIHRDVRFEVVDLPGTYSLSAYSPDEEVAREYIVLAQPDIVVNVVDATNLERNLYLTTQILETGAPLLLVLNMQDLAARRGYHVDLNRLSRLLGAVPTLPAVAARGEGIPELRDALWQLTRAKDPRAIPPPLSTTILEKMLMQLSAPIAVRYSVPLEKEIERLAALAAAQPHADGRYPARWLAVQLLEGDHSLLQDLPAVEREVLETAVAAAHSRLRPEYGEEVDLALTDERYRFVHSLVEQVLTAPRSEWSLSDRIDRIVTHRWLGIPIFMALMYLVFSLVQNVSAPYLDWIDGIIGGPITTWAAAILAFVQAPAWLISLVTDGIIAGVGGVLVFLPGLLVMYLALAVLEDTGYMARAAFVMDQTMSKLGLHGRSFVPMILGFGCNVPAIYATRTIESRGARILTGLLIPFMSCSARLPVYVIFGLAFFPRRGDLVIWALYLIGIVVAAGVGMLLSRTLFRDETAGILVMEMPAYRLPSPRRVLHYAWAESSSFVRKAGTFILVGTVIFWLLLHLPWGVTDMRQSWFGQVSGGVAPVLAPAGFGEWEAGGALLTGLLAKEMVVSTLSQVYVGEGDGGATAASPNFLIDLRDAVVGFGSATLEAGKQLLETLTPGIALFGEDDGGDETALTAALRRTFTPLSAFAFLVFVLLYIPCIATVGAQIQEFGWRWAALSAVITLLVPWTLAVFIYQGGTLLFRVFGNL